MATGCSDADSTASTDTEGSTGTTETSSASVDSATETGLPEVSSSGDIEPTGLSCLEDVDGDSSPSGEDNAPINFNPAQVDRDDDGFADIIDLCPFDASDPANRADSDDDGIGNACDRCRSSTVIYNSIAVSAGAPAELLVRGNPYQRDTDGDGIADPCDNCVVVANCQGFGTDGSSFQMGDSIDATAEDCQQDENSNFVGDACEGLELPNAAGPVGLAPTDDFDQDGMSNAADGCPRLPLPGPVTDCTEETAPEVCGADRQCVEGIWGHVDSDGDGFGNLCDSCPEVANPEQLEDGDDEDGDFIGSACESGIAAERETAPPLGFFEVSASGRCCTVELLEIDEALALETSYVLGDLLWLRDCDLQDLDMCHQLTQVNPAIADLEPGESISVVDIPLRRAEFCSDTQRAAWQCTVLPEAVATRPGMLAPPVGCEEALNVAGISAVENRVSELFAEDFAGEPNPDEALWLRGCRGPEDDHDFDGIPDQADRCPFAFNPSDVSYVDAAGYEWPHNGAACNGAFLITNICDLRDMNR